MFSRTLVILLIIDSIVLVTAILLQSGKGGGMAASFGGASSTDAFVGGRQAATILTKASWWAGGIFIFLAFVLQIASQRTRTPTSVLDQAIAVPAAPTAPSTQGNAAQSVVPLQNVTPAAPAPQPAAPTPAPAKKP